MREKIISILVGMLLIATSLVIIPNKNTVQAEESEGDGPSNGLDYEYLWTKIDAVASIIRTSYEIGEIRKGRFMGSIGGNDCKDIIIDEMTKFGLSNVRTEKLEKIGITPIYYNRLLDVVGYNLTVNSTEYDYSTDIPKSEVYPRPAVILKDGLNLDYTTTYNDAIIIHENFRLNITSEWFDSDFVISDYNSYNEEGREFVGKLEYITEEQEAPDPVDQQGRCYLFDWDNDSQGIINNLTYAWGVVLIDINERTTLELKNISYQVKEINQSAGEDLIDILDNNSDAVIDTTFENITVYYELDESQIPDSDYFVIDRMPDHIELAEDTTSELLLRYANGETPNMMHYLACLYWWQEFFLVINMRPFKPNCVGIILYSSFDHYIMPPTHLPWDMRFVSFDDKYYGFWPGNLIPMFCVNETLGEFLNDTRDDDPPTTIIGDIHQEYYAGTVLDPGVDAYNAIGELNIDESPEDKYIIISNRYDGMWGETPSDSGIGTAMVLALARYQKDLQENHNVDPKYNITYLFTTGEEMGFRGAYYHRDNLSEEDRNNIKMWIGFDQLGQDQSDLVSSPDLRSPNEGDNASINRDIIWAIANITDYENRSGYSFIPEVKTERAGSEDYVWAESVCDTIVFKKDNARIWDRWHATGDNYGKGDSLNYTDSKDVNLTYDMAWHFVKYICYDPDCWFDSISYESYDSKGGTMKDSVKATFTTKSVLPHDIVMVNASLIDTSSQEAVDNTFLNYTTNSTGVEKSITLTMPEDEAVGDYYIYIELYNSTGRINNIVGIGSENYNETVTSPEFRLHRYNSLGYNRVGDTEQSVEDVIVGSYFMTSKYGVADNITAYVYGIAVFPDPPTYKCMIYRKNDSKLIGNATEERHPDETGWWTFSFSDPKPVLVNDVEYVLVVWGDNTAKLYCDGVFDEGYGRRDSEPYGDPPPYANWTLYEYRLYSVFCGFTPETILPEITNVSNTPDIVGFGFNVTISADVTDNVSGVDFVKVNVTYPDDSYDSFSMDNIGEDTYEYVFNDTWHVGQYNYTIWAVDNSSNSNTSSGHSFNVNASATISVCTIKDTYGAMEEYINITDPPPEDPPTDNGPFDIVWEPSEDSFGIESIKAVNWTYFWNLFNTHCTWKLEGYNPGLDEWVDASSYLDIIKNYSDDNSNVKISLEFTSPYTTHYRLLFAIDKQVREYINRSGMYQFDLNYTVGDNETYNVCFNWSDLASVMDQITVNHGVRQDCFWFMIKTKNPIQQGQHIVLDPWFGSKYMFGSAKNIVDKIRGTCFKITEDGVPSDISLFVKYGACSSTGHYFLKGAIYKAQQWSDEGLPAYNVTDLVAETREVTFDLSAGPDICKVVEAGNIELLIDEEVVLEKNKWYYLLVRGDMTGGATEFKIYWHTAGETSQKTILSNVDYGNWTDPYSDNYTKNLKIHSIWCNYEKLIDISDPVPTDGDTNISISPMLNITVSHCVGNTMNITWYSNSSGDWVAFGVNSSVNNGTYHQVFSNASVNGEWWYWNVSVDDGDYTVWSDVYKFYTGVQSKIVNTGSTNISGYLLMQVEFYSDVQLKWVLDNETINETTARTINVGEQLGLDLIFNGLVTTDDLTHGDGTYRVYAAFRDPDGDVLITDDARKLEAWYEFEVDTS